MDNNTGTGDMGKQRGGRRWRRSLVAVIAASAVVFGAANAVGAAGYQTSADSNVISGDSSVKSAVGWGQSSAGVRW